jgi:hypothetical protein
MGKNYSFSAPILSTGKSARWRAGRISVLNNSLAVNPKGIVPFSPRLPRFSGATLGPRPEMETTPTALWLR